MIKLVISGCCGKMGKRIIALALADKEFKLVGAIENKGHPAIGKKINEILHLSASDIKITDNLDIIKKADALIEFTSPLATAEHLGLAAEYKKAIVIGTTGLDIRQVSQIKKASSQIPIVFSPNMSVGVNLVFRLVKELSRQLGKDYQADIVEAHHIQKKDAPSGTAKRLAELIKQSSGRKKVNIKSIREGGIVGDHQVRFESGQDAIVIKHSAKTRDIFAQGALEAARFAVRQKPGLYDMQDVITDRKVMEKR
ncbi:MAG: 4-hydroxy-tetrahydrodipicolinate reductase [Candidatus Omnitrophota bacterium]|nr:MAG: 4-hydroxy-tetrahydrodipicolinate reductase [Candidatus Omnitrophota bacterium]